MPFINYFFSLKLFYLFHRVFFPFLFQIFFLVDRDLGVYYSRLKNSPFISFPFHQFFLLTFIPFWLNSFLLVLCSLYLYSTSFLHSSIFIFFLPQMYLFAILASLFIFFFHSSHLFSSSSNFSLLLLTIAISGTRFIMFSQLRSLEHFWKKTIKETFLNYRLLQYIMKCFVRNRYKPFQLFMM